MGRGGKESGEGREAGRGERRRERGRRGGNERGVGRERRKRGERQEGEGKGGSEGEEDGERDREGNESVKRKGHVTILLHMFETPSFNFDN